VRGREAQVASSNTTGASPHNRAVGRQGVPPGKEHNAACPEKGACEDSHTNYYEILSDNEEEEVDDKSIPAQAGGDGGTEILCGEHKGTEIFAVPRPVAQAKNWGRDDPAVGMGLGEKGQDDLGLNGEDNPRVMRISAVRTKKVGRRVDGV
jgi:hypothetical protein